MLASPSNRSNGNIRQQTWVAWIGLGCILLYMVIFFSQPSLFGLTDATGDQLPRWYDLTLALLGEQMLAGLTGNGRFTATVTDRIPIVMAGCAWLAIAWSLGRFGLLWTRFDQSLSRCEVHSLSILSGLALLSTWTLLLGLAGALTNRFPMLISVLLAAPASRLAFHRLRRRRRLEESARPTFLAGEPPREEAMQLANNFDRWAARLMVPAVAGLGLLIAWGSLMPPYEFDVVEYHLQAPKEFLQEGAIRFNERNVYANMPLGAEMHALAMMSLIGRETVDVWWWGALVGKFIIGSYTLLAAALLGGFVSRHLGTRVGWSSAGCLLAAPGNVHVATAGLIDSVVGAYVLAVVVIGSSRWPPRDQGRTLGLVFFCAGAAGAAKYPGLAFAVVPSLVAWFVWEARNSFSFRERWQHALAAGAGLSLTCVPWLVKNGVQTGNPVYPLLGAIFGCRGLSGEQRAQWQAAHAIPSIDGDRYGWGAIENSLYQVTLGSPFLNPCLLGLVAAGLLAGGVRWRAWRQQAAWPLLMVWILGVWFLATHRIDRFWLPVLPLYAGLAGVGVHTLGRRISPGLACSLVLLSVGYGGFMLLVGNVGDNRLLAPLAELKRDGGSDDMPGRLSPSTAWINGNLHPNTDRLLLIGEARVFDFVPPIEYATCFNRSLAEELLRDQTASDQRRNLLDHGITHIMIHWGEIARYRSPGNYGFSPWPEPADIEQMLAEGLVVPVQWPLEAAPVQLLKVVR